MAQSVLISSVLTMYSYHNMQGYDKVFKWAALCLVQVADFPSRVASRDHDTDVDSKETLKSDHTGELLRLTSSKIM